MNNSQVERFMNMVGRRWLVVVVVCLVGFGLMPVAANYIPAYKATVGMLIVSEALKDTTLSDPDLPSIITSNDVLSKVIRRLKLDTDPTELAKKIKTKLPPKSSILELAYRDPDGARAATIANAVADESASYFHGIATRGYLEVIQALNRHIAASQAKVAAADRLLQRMSANNAFASSDKALDDLTTQINDLEVQRGQIAASLAADEATASNLQLQLRDIDPIIRGEILQRDVAYQELETQLGKDAAALASERASFRETFPGLSALEHRVNRERGEVKSAQVVAIRSGAGESPSQTQTILDSERASGLVAADRERLLATDAQLSEEQKHLKQVAGAGAVVGTLRAERDAALQQYIALTQRLGAAQGDAAQAASLGTLVVVSRAVPGRSLLWAYLLAMGVLVAALAIGAAYGLEAIDRRFWGIREMESVYGRPVLIEVGVHT